MLFDQRAFKLALSKFYFDDRRNPFNVFKDPDPKDPKMNNHPLPLKRSNAYANAAGFALLDTLDHIEELLNVFFLPRSKASRPLVNQVFENLGYKDSDLNNILKKMTNIKFAEIAYEQGILKDAEYYYLLQSLEEANDGIYDPDYIRKQIADRVNYYNMLFKLDSLNYLKQRYLNDLEFYEDIQNEIVTEYDQILEDVELEVEMKFKGLLEWKSNKDIYKVEKLKKERNEIIANDLFLSLEKYLLNKNWKKYNYQRYREEFPINLKNRLHFFKNKK